MDDRQQAFLLPFGGHLIQQAVSVVPLVGALALLPLFAALGGQLPLAARKGHAADDGLVRCAVPQSKGRGVVGAARQHPVFLGVHRGHQGAVVGAVVLAVRLTAGGHGDHAGGVFQHKAAEPAVDAQIGVPVTVKHRQVAAAPEQLRHAKRPGSKGILHRLQLERHIRRLACDALLLCCGKHPVERIADHLGAAHNVQQPVGTEDVFLLGTNRILCKYHRFFLLFLCFYEHYTNCFVTFPVYIQKSDRSIKKASLCRGRQAGRPRGVTRGRPSRPRPRRRRPWRCQR